MPWYKHGIPSLIIIKTGDEKHSMHVEFYARLVSCPHYEILKYGVAKVYEIVYEIQKRHLL